MKVLKFWPLLATLVAALVIVGFATGLLEWWFGWDVSGFLRALSWPVYAVLAFVLCFGVWGLIRWASGE